MAAFLAKRLFVAALLAMLSLPASGQTRNVATVTGRVLEAETGSALPSAAVELRRTADSTLAGGTATDADGRFIIRPIQPGDYFVRISFVGYVSEVVSGLTLSSGEQRELGEIRLRTDTAELGEVSVSAEREYMEVGIDRTVYNTREQPLNMGGSASDVLANIPSVEVDIDGNLSLRGSQGVSVYLNGKPAPMSGEALTSFLQGLSAADIERVEVIPNPSARYEPEGMSGILNIVLAKDAGPGWGAGVNTAASTRGRYRASVNGHYGNGPWTVFGNYSLRYSTWQRGGWRFRENRYLDPLTYLRQEMSGENAGISNYLNASIDYAASERSTVSLSGIIRGGSSTGDEFNTYLELDAEQDPTYRYSRTSDDEDTRFGMDYRLNFQHVITPREHELSVEARYEDDRSSELERLIQRVLPVSEPGVSGSVTDRQHLDEDESERELSFEADYVRPLTEKIRAELGVDTDFEWVDQSFYSESLDESGAFRPDADLNNRFVYAEQQYSAYGVLSATHGQFGAQLGLRFERAITNFDLRTTRETFRNAYTSLFPSVHLSYELSKGNTLKGAYSKRVRRPREWQLNPFGDYDDPTFRRMGNPYLTPEYTHSVELSYTRLGEAYTVTASPYVRYSVDEISWHERITDEGVTILTFENFDTELSYGTELITSLSLGRWFKGELSTNLYKQVTEAGSLSSELSNNALGFRSRLSSTVALRDNWKLQISQSYRSPMDVPGGRISARTRTDLALRQDFFGDRLSFGIRIQDLFDATDNLIERDMERYYLQYYREQHDRAIQVSLRYVFRDGGRREGGGGGRGHGRY